MNLGEKIKALRKQQKMSIDELAKKCGKSRATLYRYENGDIKNIPATILESIAKALHTTPTVLLGLEDEKASINDLWQKEFANETFTDTETQEIVDFVKKLIERRK